MFIVYVPVLVNIAPYQVFFINFLKQLLKYPLGMPKIGHFGPKIGYFGPKNSHEPHKLKKNFGHDNFTMKNLVS